MIDILNTTQLSILLIVELITDRTIGQSVAGQNLNKIKDKSVSAFVVQGNFQLASTIIKL